LQENTGATGEDYQLLCLKYNIKPHDLRWFLGLSLPAYSETVLAKGEKGQKSLLEQRVAISVRVLDQYPYLLQNFALNPLTTVQDALDLAEKLSPTKVRGKEFGAFFGRSIQTGTAWISRGGIDYHKKNRTFSRMLEMFVRILSDKGAEGLQTWKKITEQEAKARGIDDIWKAGW